MRALTQHRYQKSHKRVDSDRRLKRQTLETARREYPKLDLCLMEQLWRDWASRQQDLPRNTQAAFLGFCRRYVARRADDDQEDADDRPPPHLEALWWWHQLPPETKEAAVKEFQICGQGRDWAFARTDKQIIETAAWTWAGIDCP